MVFKNEDITLFVQKFSIDLIQFTYLYNVEMNKIVL